MASLSGKKVKDTYKGLIKTSNNSAVTSSNVELTDGNGNGIGVQVNTSGNVTASGAVTGNTIVKSGGTALQILLADGTIITLTRESDGIGSNDSDSNIPSNAAVKNYVDTEITNLIASAPSALDTLNELAAALGDDANFSATITTALGKRLQFDASQSLTSGEVTQALTNLGITATVAEVNFVDGVTSNIQTQLDGLQSAITGGATTVTDNDLTASRALVSDSSGKISASDITSTEIGHLDNVSSNIQTQIDGKQATITGAATTIDDADLTASKALISNSSGKVAVSSVTDTELGHVSGVTSAIQTQINAKEDTITGGASSITSSDLTASKALESDSSGKVSASSVTSTELGHLSGVSSAIQTQINAKQDTITGAATTIDDSDLTASRAVVSDASGKISVSNVTSAEILNLDGVTSNIQDQLDGLQSEITGAAVTVTDVNLTADKAMVSSSTGKIATSDVTTTELSVLDGITASTDELNILDGVTSTTAELNILDGVTADANELNILDGVTSTTAELNKLDGVTADTNELNILDGVTADTNELNILDGVTATTSELNILDGVTSTTDELNILDGVTATTTELNYTDGVTSAIQDQLDGKQATITGAATTIDDADLTADRALLSNAEGKVAVSAVTNTELGYLDGVTSNVQDQFDNLTDGSTATPLILTVTVVNSGGNKYAIDGQVQETLTLLPNTTYRFDQSDSSNATHPLKLSSTSDGTHNSGSAYGSNENTTYVGTAGSTGAYTQIVTKHSTDIKFYYYCANHSGMGGAAYSRYQTYGVSAVDSGDDAIIRLTGSDSSTDDVTLAAGDNITLTPSGDTITIASSASGGGGGGGGISWQSDVKTANFNASSGEGYFVDTSSAVVTATLPSSPSVGDLIAFTDYGSNFNTNRLALDPNGNKIKGSAGGQALEGRNQAARLVYSGSTKGWLNATGANEGTTALAITDLPTDFRVLMIGGGGGGGYGAFSAGNYNAVGGGGGAGEFLDKEDVPIYTATDYTVTIGSGGAQNANGTSTSLVSDSGATITFDYEVYGGGHGGYYGDYTGDTGGSSGGAGMRRYPSMGVQSSVAATKNEGAIGSRANDGGDTNKSSTYVVGGGGGGGAGAAGSNGAAPNGGAGGDGYASDITGTSTTYAGGGGGGSDGPSNGTVGTGGSGGGGGPDSAGSANTGSGGSGNHYNGSGYAGGSGVMILRYPNTYTLTETTSTAVLTMSTSTDGSFKVTTITAGTNGTIQFN